MKTKTIKMLLATVVAAIAVNAFVIVSNSNAGMSLLRGNVEALTDPGSGGAQGPMGNKFAKDYHCQMTMNITVTETKNQSGTHYVSANVSGGTGPLLSTTIDLSANAGYAYTNNSGNTTSTLFETTITDDNYYEGLGCDMQNYNDCTPWVPCGYYHAEYAKGVIEYQTGYSF